MVYISIPVHENMDAIVSLLHNFKKFQKKSICVLHISKNSNLKLQDLDRYLRSESLTNYVLNPVSINTNMLNILDIHLENIKFIKSFGDAIKIIFHSSNDMLVKGGSAEYVTENNAGFNTHLVRPNTIWTTGKRALDDLRLKDILDFIGSDEVIGTQIEGSFYRADSLFEILNIMDRFNGTYDTNKYPEEEVYFSSILYALGDRPDGYPYIYSEVQIVNELVWKVCKSFNINFENNIKFKIFLYKVINKIAVKLNFNKINLADIENIIRKNYAESNYVYRISDTDVDFFLYDISNIFGVKRVPRDLNNPIRKYIDNL